MDADYLWGYLYDARSAQQVDEEHREAVAARPRTLEEALRVVRRQNEQRRRRSVALRHPTCGHPLAETGNPPIASCSECE